jgi:hypothetical protein
MGATPVPADTRHCQEQTPADEDGPEAATEPHMQLREGAMHVVQLIGLVASMQLGLLLCMEHTLIQDTLQPDCTTTCSAVHAPPTILHSHNNTQS